MFRYRFHKERWNAVADSRPFLYGLAKVEEAAAISLETSPTLSVAQTAAGVLLGTAAYMSPEQARGKAVDKRADIWAFGIVLYEMLTGKQLFSGETVSDTLAATLKEEPDFEKIPTKVRPLLRSCLEKNPSRRLRDIGDGWRLLESAPQSETMNPDFGHICGVILSGSAGVF